MTTEKQPDRAAVGSMWDAVTARAGTIGVLVGAFAIISAAIEFNRGAPQIWTISPTLKLIFFSPASVALAQGLFVIAVCSYAPGWSVARSVGAFVATFAISAGWTESLAERNTVVEALAAACTWCRDAWSDRSS